MSFSDESALSEPPSDNEENQETMPQAPAPQAPAPQAPAPDPPARSARTATQQATARSQNRANPTISPRLHPPSTQNQCIPILYGLLKRGTINVDPEYQRGVVWGAEKQMGLIDSLMHNYYVPPIIFSCTRGVEDEPDSKTCIDGKQRLTSVQQFVEGEIAWRDSQTNRRLWYKNKSGKRGKLMSEAQRNRFNDSSFVCVEYNTLNVSEEREIFQRVQLGVALSPAERLKAINGSYADLVRKMENSLPPNFKHLLGWDNAKGRDFLVLARLVYIIDHCRTKSDARLTEPTNAAIEKYLQDKQDLKKDLPATVSTAALEVMETLNCIFTKLRGESNPALLTDTFCGMYPVEFLVACYAVHHYREKFSVARLSDAIRRMRKAVKGVGSRPSTKVHKELMEFVCKAIPKLGGNNGGEPLASSVKYVPTPEDMEVPVASTSVSSNRTGTFAPKRKREQEDEDGDADSEADAKPKPKRKPGRPRKHPVVLEEDSDDDHSAVIVPVPPRPKTPVARESVSKKLANTNSASGSKTTVKRTTTKAKASTSAPVKSKVAKSKPAAKDAQIGIPSVPPAAANRTRQTPNAVASTSTSHIERAPNAVASTSTSHIERVNSGQKSAAPSPSAAYMTPPTSTTSIVPPRNTIPLPGRSRPHTPMTVDLSSSKPAAPNDVKPEARNSPIISSAPPRQSSNQPDRLAAIREAKNKIAVQHQQNSGHVFAPPATHSQATQDPRRRTVQPTMGTTSTNVVEDAEAQFHSKLDELPHLLSPEASHRPPSGSRQVSARLNAVASSSAPQQQPPPPSASTDVTMADRTDILNNSPPIGRVSSSQGRVPPVLSFKKNGGTSLNLDTNVDHLRRVATPALSGISQTPRVSRFSAASIGANQGHPPPQTPAMSRGSSAMSISPPPPPSAPAAYYRDPPLSASPTATFGRRTERYDHRDRQPTDRWSQSHSRNSSMDRRQQAPSYAERHWEPAPEGVRGPRGGLSRGAS
ncbi:hypothetical protein Hypma_011065 [Hypsizygus marmoreus]|uniref:GmrSD restriction endonucleases N-terminal domain-containing protein n=1 Tax=Hypsizygus marmoreus TaxID=39966 RepID=A0A369JIJ6_HYPMA|nr:hypothetical protein Hypma_011065 [Hypsizygus marmoreus]